MIKKFNKVLVFMCFLFTVGCSSIQLNSNNDNQNSSSINYSQTQRNPIFIKTYNPTCLKSTQESTICVVTIPPSKIVPTTNGSITEKGYIQVKYYSSNNRYILGWVHFRAVTLIYPNH